MASGVDMRTGAFLLFSYAALMVAEAQSPCVNGMAGPYPCQNVDLLSRLTLAQLGATGGSPNTADLWGWTDPLTQREYAIIGLNNGTAFVDVTVPSAPVRIGNLPSHLPTSNLWRDVDVSGNWCYVGSELAGHGLQVFDLTRLRNVPNPPVTFTEDAHYPGFGNSHTIYADKLQPYVYAVGTGINSGGITALDVSDPMTPVLVGTFSQEGYIHENVVYTYIGPDMDHQGQQISFNFHSGSPDKITIVDVTDKSDMNLISSFTYAEARITHQGWLTEDHCYLLMDDEGDEGFYGHGTRTRIFDVRDLDAPIYVGAYTSPLASTDHNLYTHRGLVFQSNYTSGLRILDTTGVSAGSLSPVAHFDTYTANDGAAQTGAWGNYPYFPSGTVIVSDMVSGLFILKPRLSLRLRVFLEGPFDAVGGMMKDDLRQLSLLPISEPYSGLGYVYTGPGAGAMVTNTAFLTAGADAIVDWVVVELRDATNVLTVLSSRPALVQRDGDVVGLDGISPVQFDIAPGNYRIVLRQRNHLGVMTGQAVQVSVAERTYDLSDGSVPLHGVQPTKVFGSVNALWAGNANRDDVLKYAGVNNDRDLILTTIGGSTPTNTVVGYLSTDVNMDGVTKYAGSANDRDPILVNIGGFLPTATRFQQIP